MSEHRIESGKEVTRALTRAYLLSLGLAAIKLAAYFYTDSLIVLASALDSCADTVNSFVNLRIAKLARSEPDREHPFGHGGFEVFGAVVQGAVILAFGVSLLIEAMHSLTSGPGVLLAADRAQVGVAVLLLSAVGGYLIHRGLAKSAENVKEMQARSLALDADHAHYVADIAASLLAATGLALAYYMKMPKIDALFTLAAAVFFFKAAYPILRKSYRDIVHQEVDPALQQVIVDTVMNCSSQIIGIHLFRSREHGPEIFVDFHMVVRGDVSLKEAHSLSDLAVVAIKRKVPRVDVIIHLDPDDEPEEKGWEASFTLRKRDLGPSSIETEEES